MKYGILLLGVPFGHTKMTQRAWERVNSPRFALPTWVAIYLKQSVWLGLFPFAVFMSPEACTALSTFQKFEK